MFPRTVVIVAAALALSRSVASFSPTPTCPGVTAGAFEVASKKTLIRALQLPPRRGDITPSRHFGSVGSPFYLDFGNSDGGNDRLHGQSNALGWVSLGISWTYLAHFASLYTQLPGLFGPTGLLPASGRVANLDGIWALNALYPAVSPELGLEVFAAGGIIVSALQIIVGDKLRVGPAGVALFSLQWLLWHDLVYAGGRFTAYQMDLLLLDAAPLTVLAASGLVPAAATFGYRWLLSRLYVGAGAVKLLSCDASWRDLSAVHWHLQSQPLPNLIGAAAYLHLPDGIGRGLTLAVLAGEMAAPFLFLSPSAEVRRFAFVLNVLLMVGIALFGNFGPLQFLLLVIGFALLDDLPPPPGTSGAETGRTRRPSRAMALASDDAPVGGSVDDGTAQRSAPTTVPDLLSMAVTTISVALAAGAAFWAIYNAGASRCGDTLAVAPLVYDLIALGGAVAILPPLLSASGGGLGGNDVSAALSSLVILGGSAGIMAEGLGVPMPAFMDAFEALDFGASPYGLFAIITGVGGRPVATIEAAQSADGPWHYVPLLFQTNDPSAPLPVCWPHFPRLDWTLWFVPLGERGVWIARLLRGITAGDPSVVGLLDEAAFSRTFPNAPPEIVRIVPRTYELDSDVRGWSVARDPDSTVLITFVRDGVTRDNAVDSSSLPMWPSSPFLRPLAASGRPEYFVWGCLGATEAARRLTTDNSTKGTVRRD